MKNADMTAYPVDGAHLAGGANDEYLGLTLLAELNKVAA